MTEEHLERETLGWLADTGYSGFLTGGHGLLARTANHVLGLQDGKKRFGDTALAMSKAFTLCCTLDEAKAVREEVAFFQAVKVLLTKREISGRKRTLNSLKRSVSKERSSR